MSNLHCVPAPNLICNTTTPKAVQMKKQPLPANQQLQKNAKLHTFNPQYFNPEMLKQIVVGNPGSGATATLASGTKLLKPTILQNNPITQQQQQKQQIRQLDAHSGSDARDTTLPKGCYLSKAGNQNLVQQQQIQNNHMLKNKQIMIATPQQQQQPQHQQLKLNNHTIITTTSGNSSQMFATLGMDFVTPPPLVQTVQKLPQVSLLQTPARKSTNISEIINEPVTILKNPHEIKLGNLNSEVSFIQKPNLSTTELKSNELSLLKPPHKIQPEIPENSFQIKTTKKEKLVEKKKPNSSSLLKLNQEDGNTNNKLSNTLNSIEQKSLLKPKILNKKSTTLASTASTKPYQTSPRSQRSSSCNTPYKTTNTESPTSNERRHSEPSKSDFLKKTNTNDLDMFFEDEEYLESSGDKSYDGYEKSSNVDNTSPSHKKKEAEIVNRTKTANSHNSQGKDSVKCNQQQVAESMEVLEEIKTPHDFSNKGTSSEDDDVTILPTEEVEIEQIEIDDDDDDVDCDNVHTELSPHTIIRSVSQEKEQINELLLCDEQFIISSSSSISNYSSDHNSTTASQTKSPLIDNTTAPLLKRTLMERISYVPKEEPRSNGYSTVLEMLSNFNMLNWKEQIGTARGTSLKFELNEFNILQLHEKNMPKRRVHTAYEKPIYERESSHKRNENSDAPTNYTCRRCNIQGPAVDFMAPEFCSWSCVKCDIRKRRDDTATSSRKRSRSNNINNTNNSNNNNNNNANTKKINKNTSNDNDTTSINNPPLLSYIKKPKFRWNSYMNRNNNIQAAPISLFLNPFPTGPNNFVVGMKLEAIDPENCSLFCVCTVVSIMGYRLKLSFDGYGSAYDFWLNADSMDIFPPGWCAKTNRILQPPKGISSNKFNWGAYLNREKATSAPRHLFTHLNSSLVSHNPFKLGMHLEAEDLNDTGKLCVSSVADVLNDRIRIHFDGWDDCYDIIVDINSPYIHPCGWHEGRQQLVVPPDFENATFNWNDYIRKQNTGEAASKELFAPREPINFMPNMRLEVVDPRNSSLIRPATVVAHKGHRVKLHLDGWPSDYCFWLEDDSPDLHPIGWCDATDHDFEPPPGYEMTDQKMPCPVDGCRGIGNAKNAFKCFHATKEDCPYAAENWLTVVEKAQRLDYDNIVKTLPRQGKHSLIQQALSSQTRLSEQQILERLHMLDNIKTRNVLTQQDSITSQHSNLLTDFSLPHLKKEETKESKCSKISNYTFLSSSSPSSNVQQQNSESTPSSLDVKLEIAKEFLYDYGPRLQQNFTLWQKNFSFNTDKIKRNPLKWSTTEVSVFIDLYLSCRKTAAIFNHEDIDGEAFLLLGQQDLTENLGMKLGPAVRLYSCILQLRILTVTKFKVTEHYVSAEKQKN